MSSFQDFRVVCEFAPLGIQCFVPRTRSIIYKRIQTFGWFCPKILRNTGLFCIPGLMELVQRNLTGYGDTKANGIIHSASAGPWLPSFPLSFPLEICLILGIKTLCLLLSSLCLGDDADRIGSKVGPFPVGYRQDRHLSLLQ